MRLSLLHENEHDPPWGWRLEPDGLWHREDHEPIELLHNAEQALLKFTINEVTPGIVGYKICGEHSEPGQAVVGYVLAGDQDAKFVDFHHSGSYGGDWLLKVALPEAGQRSTRDQYVWEWGSRTCYPAGNPGLNATSDPVKPGDEILMLVPSVVIDCYKLTKSDGGQQKWRNNSGDEMVTRG